MKNLLSLCVVTLLALFVTSSTLSGVPGSKKRLGIATYSVKGLETDIPGSFKSLADAGYVTMEISNYNAATGMVAGYKPADYSALAKQYGLEVISSHARAKFDVKDVEGSVVAWAKLFDDHKSMGCKYVVFPMNIWAGTVEGVKAECDLMNKIGAEAVKRGIKFGYHNHHTEFVKIANTDLIYEDFLIANTDPDKVFFQMDVYWITQGGQDPVAYLKKYPTRFKLLHIKDEYVVGASGKINYEAIFSQFYKNGNEDWFVEMEAKMTEEQRAQSMGMMNAMKEIQAKGGSMNDLFAQMAPKPQTGADGKETKPAAPPPGFGPQDPAVVAEQLKTSLEGIKQSADYLLKSDFVK
jgi:sugar phosphate isomerase/epimerase